MKGYPPEEKNIEKDHPEIQEKGAHLKEGHPKSHPWGISPRETNSKKAHLKGDSYL